jgi:hypothetical protein
VKIEHLERLAFDLGRAVGPLFAAGERLVSMDPTIARAPGSTLTYSTVTFRTGAAMAIEGLHLPHVQGHQFLCRAQIAVDCRQQLPGDHRAPEAFHGCRMRADHLKREHGLDSVVRGKAFKKFCRLDDPRVLPGVGEGGGQPKKLDDVVHLLVEEIVTCDAKDVFQGGGRRQIKSKRAK